MICQRKTTQVLCKNRIHTTKPLTTLAWKTTETKRLETNFVPEFEEGDDNEGGKATPAEISSSEMRKERGIQETDAGCGIISENFQRKEGRRRKRRREGDEIGENRGREEGFRPKDPSFHSFLIHIGDPLQPL